MGKILPNVPRASFLTSLKFFFKTPHPIYPNLHVPYHILINFTLPSFLNYALLRCTRILQVVSFDRLHHRSIVRFTKIFLVDYLAWNDEYRAKNQKFF